MDKVKILLVAAVLLSTAGLAQGEDKIGATFDITYMSKLMDKGGEYYGQKGGFLQTLDLDLWGTGFGVAVGHREAISSGYVNKERFDYVIHYGNSMFDGETYKTNYSLAWIFHQFPDQPRSTGNYYEYVLALSWDELLPGGLCPNYTMAYETPAGHGYGNRNSAGFWHLFGLSCGVKVPGLPGLPSSSDGSTDLDCKLSVEAAYRDGMGGGATDHDWSHMTLGASTKFQVSECLSFVPGLYHQISMDDSVCKGDVTYASLSLKFEF